jgi:LCP family protein required for cell wall assembly
MRHFPVQSGMLRGERYINKSMNHSGIKSSWVLGGMLLSVLALLVILYPELNKRWNTPLGPELGLPSITPGLPAETESSPVSSPLASRQDSAAEAGNVPQTPTPRSPTAVAIPTETPQPLCGGPPIMTILAVGADNREDSYTYGLADVIRIVRVDFVTPRVTVFSLPRDLWVEIPDIGDSNGITHGKLNQAYFYGTPGMGYYDGPGGAAGLLARTLDVNFGLRVDHYGVVNMQTFVRIVDAVGGVDVYLPRDVDGGPTADFPWDLGYYSAGQHHLNGEQALTLSRIRHKYSDFFRMDNQSRVICALKDKITTPTIILEIPELISALKGSILTDLTPQQLAQLACLAPKLKSEDLLFTGLPQEILSFGRVYSPGLRDETSSLEADPQVIQDFADRFTNGGMQDEQFCP